MERLQKIIAESGLTSRRKAEDLIKAGKVKVNGIVTKELGTKASYEDSIFVDGKNILLGRSSNKEDAITKRLKAEKKYFKEFAPQKHLFEDYLVK